eukprot:m.101843 g.101843  ORF g.101843 m.101843 type:complete len:61 (+) comp13209_c0_seq4:716-898(+)
MAILLNIRHLNDHRCPAVLQLAPTLAQSMQLSPKTPQTIFERLPLVPNCDQAICPNLPQD